MNSPYIEAFVSYGELTKTDDRARIDYEFVHSTVQYSTSASIVYRYITHHFCSFVLLCFCVLVYPYMPIYRIYRTRPSTR